MLTIVLVAASLAAGGSNVLWLDAYQVKTSGIEAPEAGTYQVWAWAPDDAKAVVVVDGKSLEGAFNGKAQKKYVWLKLGEVALKAGKSEASLGEGVAGIVLSPNADAEFDPKALMGNTRVLDRPEAIRDRRAETAKHTDTVFTMPVFASKEEWEAFAAPLRERILLSSGLWPLPEKTPLNAEITGRIAHDDYTVEKVRFEALPGFFVTGNLYRPTGKGPFPGVANPHGHWKEGRLADEALGCIPARCITMARMGMVAFSYDMIGYNDSLQFPHNWGGPREKLWGVHPYAMQLWSSIRVVDFLQSLPDVDPERIACTGASGGGTQTFSLMAVDPRVEVAAPVNMISHSMQGGCLCENAPILRLANSNMEIGATMAPRPMLMVSATGDWTRETPRIEYPAIKSIYALYGAEDKLANVHVDSGHNYNKDSREAVYRFFGKWLLGDAAKWANFTEPPYQVEKHEDLLLYPDKKLPEGMLKSDAIIEQVIEANRAKWNAVLPQKPEDVPAFLEKYGNALGLVLGTELPKSNDLDPERTGYEEHKEQGYVVERWVIHRRCAGDAIPALLYRVYGPQPQDTVLLVHGKGKAALADWATGGPGPLVAGLMAQGKAVMAIDTFLLGEHNGPDGPAQRKQEGGFMDTFQPTDTGCRIQDILTSVAYLLSRRDFTGAVDVVGLEDGGLWCLFASALDGRIRRTFVDANRFDPADDQAWVSTNYVPCIRSIGDVATAAAMIAPRTLVAWNAVPAMAQTLEARYKAAGTETLKASSEGLSQEALLEALK